jgi:hypothetical protein
MNQLQNDGGSAKASPNGSSAIAVQPVRLEGGTPNAGTLRAEQ